MIEILQTSAILFVGGFILAGVFMMIGEVYKWLVRK